ncbi:hypothetical protein RFI02_04115 [Acinetobacter sichuanensis]|uniref:hypothetical protein n=1 Tax=Acinetobacter sichuanensis TaxID=2136183 RepID=UPI00280E87CD|nr:hypothetical protein [Acinetobacter sichuanensis]MDQ9020287.1 hypothetical protein [Acinetobacter sichuanensis]
MKKIFLALTAISIILSGCSSNKMPKECEESWQYIEKMAKTSGISEEAIKNQKKAFEDEVNKMSKEEATEVCKTQTAILGMVK